jgi:translation initiation factor 5B
LHRSWHLVESFAASFCALNFIGAVRFVYSRISQNDH